MRRIVIILAALLIAAPAAAQQRGFTVDELEGLLLNHVASDRILLLVQQRCIHFTPDKIALGRLAKSGATPELLEGIAAPGQCSTLGATARPAADVPAAAEVRRGKPLFVAGVALASGGFRPDDGASVRGPGAAVDIAVEGARFGAFAHGEFAEVDLDDGEPFSLGHTDFGVRLFLLARGAVRPYLDVAGTVLSMEYNDPDTGDTAESVTGFGATGAAGLRIGLSPKLALDGSVRVTRGTLRQLEADDSTALLGEPRGGLSTRVMAGVSWTPGGR